MERRKTRSHGFTLVELLVVITIIGMLMGLLFPAVHSVLESAREYDRLSQMRQIGKAAMTYEGTYGTLPATTCRRHRRQPRRQCRLARHAHAPIGPHGSVERVEPEG